VNALVLNVLNSTQCLQHAQSRFSTLSVINEATTFAPDLGEFCVCRNYNSIVIMRI